jgi:hypothetical protein
MIKTGYSSTEYAEVYENENSQVLGFPYENFLKNKIPGTEYYDYSNVYPFLANNYHWLADDFDKNAVSSVLITNPLREVVINRSMELEVYKEHSVVELSKYSLENLPTNHKRNINKSNLNVTVAPNPSSFYFFMDAVYGILREKHGIKGITNYNKEQIAKLLSVPGTYLFVTSAEGYIVNYCLFYAMDNDIYYHIGTSTARGYELQSNFQVIHEACLFFKQLGFNRLLLGAVPDGGGDGLKRFKSGFATKTVNNYILKTIINSEIYAKLSENKPDNGFFPRYKA